MKKKVTNYLIYLEELKCKKISKDILDNILIHIGFFQHERLVHLIVTFFTGICMVLVFLSSLFIENIALVILFILLLLLFIPYILHYYFLENSVQRMYDLYEDLRQKKDM